MTIPFKRLAPLLALPLLAPALGHAQDPAHATEFRMQQQYIEQYRQKYPEKHFSGALPENEQKFTAPEGYSDSYDHFHNFFDSVRSRKPVVEDATFGFRAAGAALLSNLSIQRGEVVRWNPETMKLAERS